MRPKKKNHEAVGSPLLTLGDTDALLYDLVTRRENQEKTESRALSYKKIGIPTSRNYDP